MPWAIVCGFFAYLCRLAARVALVVAAGVPGVAIAATHGTARADTSFVAISDLPAAAQPGARVRTTSRIDLLLAQRLVDGRAAQLINASNPMQVLDGERNAGVWLGAWSAQVPVPAGLVRQSLGYPIGPMAILRSDTTIHDWNALASRTVCVVEDEPYVGEIAARFGALEQRYPSATDALLAVRAGRCDAGVLSNHLLDALQKFPEWKKFSARLPAYRHVDLVWVSTEAGADEFWRSRMQEVTSAQLAAMTTQQAREIAFEVYLDQVVPDCH